jgi:hypothetical protein
LEVRPSSGSASGTVLIEIVGENFYAVPHANFDDKDRAYANRVFVARLESHTLESVTLVGPTKLTAVVPAGLPPRTYDLEIVAPDGKRASAPAAYTVLGAVDAGGDLGPDDGPTEDQTAPDLAPPPPVTQLFTDPFGDGTRSAFVFKYGGMIYLGPRKTGKGALRAHPDGSSCETVTFAFQADQSGGSITRNTQPAPYPSIGHEGCAANTHNCGPDNEDGRGIFGAGTIAGKEWLVVAGVRTAGDLNYAYMTSDTGLTLGFRYVDLAPMMGPQTKGSSAMHVFNGRVYLGFPDSGGKRPYLVVVKTTPGTPGLDATASDAENLGADLMPGIGVSGTPANPADPSIIDSIIDFKNKLYVLNNGGCICSKTAAPGSYTASGWAPCTPSAADFTAKTSITTSKVGEIEPADKAFPQLAVFKGRLYAGRNTTTGPQLWACTPGADGAKDLCDPGDWTLVAANSTGDGSLSQFDNPDNTRISLVSATADHLYVGFDNAKQGLVVFRSNSTAPGARSDFEGESGCPASAHPATCEGLGGNGLGSAGNTRVLHGVALGFSGKDYVYLVAGDGTGPVKVFRIRD